VRTTKPDDTVSRPTKAVYKPLTQEWQIQCDQSKKVRDCLVTPGATHDSNNCLLFVSRWEASYRVAYHCTAAACSGCAKPVIGYVTYGTDYMWHSERSVRAPSVPDAAIPEPPPVDGLVDLKDPVMNTYELVKERFELECFKLLKPTGVFGIVHKGEVYPQIVPCAQMKMTYADLYYFEPKEKGGYQQKIFADRWIRDPKSRKVRSVVVDPTYSQLGTYNIWRPFKASLLTPVEDAQVEALVKPIYNHIQQVVTNNVDEFTDWVFDWMANMIQHPESKSQVAVLLYGEEGCGKGVIFQFLRRQVLGDFCSFQTSDPAQHLFGTFANGAIHRVCVQIDEVKSLHDFHDKLKDLITNDTLNYEQKGKDSIVLDNLVNLILTTNNENALTVTPGDRRFSLFRCNSKFVRDTAYFDDLRAHLNRPDVARAFYQFLMQRDISKYSSTGFQDKRPITKYYEETRLNGISVLSRFMSAMVNGVMQRIYKARDLYNLFTKFHTNGNYKFVMTEHAFGRELQRMPGVERKRTNACVLYTTDADTIKKNLLATHRYDEFASCE